MVDIIKPTNTDINNLVSGRIDYEMATKIAWREWQDAQLDAMDRELDRHPHTVGLLAKMLIRLIDVVRHMK